MQQHSGILQINLSALRRNWRLLSLSYSGEECGAVVKTNAYGLGVLPVARALFAEGCQTFFVANFAEGLKLRELLPSTVTVFVLQGCVAGMESHFIRHHLIPVIISLSMYRRWQLAVSVGCAGVHTESSKPRCAIKVNTGMNRLGMMPSEFLQIANESDGLTQAGVLWLMSHLACADEPAHPLNQTQLEAFSAVVTLAKQKIPSLRASLVNSAGVFLPRYWQFDIARPGIGLFGAGMTVPGMPEFHSVVSLSLPVLQVRALSAGESIGYGATFKASKDMKVAIVAGGYGDGILRALSGLAFGWFGQYVPLLGRISMDSCVFDVSHLLGDDCPTEGDAIEIVGEHCCLDELASRAGTIAYELLTRLGDRLEKQYCE